MVMTSGASLRNYFDEELRGLREDAVSFARDYPAVAGELELSGGRSRDPQVELLMQSFAYLTGRLRFRLDEERALLPNVLLGQLYPHLQAPIPAMAVAQIEVQADGANFIDGWTLARGRQLSAEALDGEGRRLACRFRTCYDTPLWPLNLERASFVPTNRYDFLRDAPGVLGAISVTLTARGHYPIQNLPLNGLRFHLHGEDGYAFKLYELLAGSLKEVVVVVRDPARPADAQAYSHLQRLPADAVRWLGFGEEEAVLPAAATVHPGHRLLQEYFAFREKFLFFEINGIDAAGADHEVELLFLLDSAPSRGLALRPGALRLNCVPLVNLYPQAVDPVRLDQRHHEYRLSADLATHRHSEIHTVTALHALRPGERPRPVAPYFSMEAYDRLDDQDYFYVTRRAESQLRSVPGTELYVSFLDQRLDLAAVPADAIGGTALCTNRRLPERLSAGDPLTLEGAGPLASVRLLAKPTTHKSPHLLGSEPWALLSQLAVSQLSLSGSHGALESFRHLLTLHSVPDVAMNMREIEAIRQVHGAAAVRNMGSRAWRGLCRGEVVTLVVDEHGFDEGSALLFGEVLQYFIALYANVNAFTQLVLESKQRKGKWREWPPMVGARPVL